LEISKSLCPEPVGFLTYIFAVVGSILAIGILTLLLWKLLTMWHDRAEFQKFEKERAAARWDTVWIKSKIHTPKFFAVS